MKRLLRWGARRPWAAWWICAALLVTLPLALVLVPLPDPVRLVLTGTATTVLLIAISLATVQGLRLTWRSSPRNAVLIAGIPLAVVVTWPYATVAARTAIVAAVIVPPVLLELALRRRAAAASPPEGRWRLRPASDFVAALIVTAVVATISWFAWEGNRDAEATYSAIRPGMPLAEVMEVARNPCIMGARVQRGADEFEDVGIDELHRLADSPDPAAAANLRLWYMFSALPSSMEMSVIFGPDGRVVEVTTPRLRNP